MRINNRDKFHLHSICGSWAILGHFGVFWGPNSPKYSLILVKVAPEAVFGENKRVLENSTFQGNCTSPKFNLFLRFCPTLGPIYPMKEAKIEKSKNFKVKIQASGYPNRAKSRPYLVLIFQEKHDYFLLHFGPFLVKKGTWSRVNGSESKSNPAYAGATTPGVQNM